MKKKILIFNYYYKFKFKNNKFFKLDIACDKYLIPLISK